VLKFDGAGTGATVTQVFDDLLIGTLSATTVSATTIQAGGSDVLVDIVDDTSPQLGGNLDVNGNYVVTTSNADLQVAPNGTGKFVVRGNDNSAKIVLNCEVNTHGVTIASPPHSAGATYELELPDADGSDGQALVTDGSGKLSFSDVVTEDGTQTLSNKTLAATTMSGTLSMADNIISRPVLEDYAIQGSAIGNTGATQTFDLSTANFFSATLDQNSTFTFSNPPGSGDFGGFVLELTNGGAFTITFPASVDWPGGTAPTLTASGVDQLVFTTRDGGTTYFGFTAGLDIKTPA